MQHDMDMKLHDGPLFFMCVRPVLGAWGNTRVIIRRKRGYEDMTDVTVDDPLAVDQPTKFVIEITTGELLES